MDIHACLTFWICYLLCSFCFFLFPSSCGVHTEPRWTQNSGENINVETEPVKRKKMDLCFSACGGFQYVVSAPFYRLFLWGWENSREEDVLTWNTPHPPPPPINHPLKALPRSPLVQPTRPLLLLLPRFMPPAKINCESIAAIQFCRKWMKDE